ncbi:uncharacterized protein LOC131247971 [Magnolia sinica]|uniref:uncharacterized protein LOC131247971 n=1 Tax=Magnolia sinica TaxID=86752 RepID=UPI002659CE56|nr:uncharacterized protein LOC131247971 [Magnolia sinica]XP_058103961.1 uncharacterized protein LOC131247971 [Magnolia sinica]
MEYASWVHPRNFQSTSNAGLNSFHATQANPEMRLTNIPMVPGGPPEASQNVGFENGTIKIRRQQPLIKSSDRIASKALRPKQTKRKTSARKCTSPKYGKKNTVIIVNGTAVDFSGVPTPVCSCTGLRRQCYRWGAGGWQSSCCTTSISEYPLPMSSSRPGARMAGRKMSSGAYIKLLQRLAAEGHDLSNAVDLKNHWARHGTNKFVTISIISEAETEASTMEFASWVHQKNFLSATKASTNSSQATRVNPEIHLTDISMVPSTQADTSQNGEFDNKTTKIRSLQPFTKQPDRRIASKVLRPKQSKNSVPKMKKRKGSSQATMKHENNNNDIFINGRALDFSGVPTPVCSCTGIRRQCYRWGTGGWQSSCCTTSISEYPLPMSLSRPGARLAGRKMSNGAYGKLLHRLAAEGHDLSKAVDLKNHWARHGTNKFVTISIISEAVKEASTMDFTGWVHQRNFQSATKAGPNSSQASQANAEMGIGHIPMLPGVPGNMTQNGELENKMAKITNLQHSTKKSNQVASKVLRPKQSKKTKRKGSSKQAAPKCEKKSTGIIINGTTLDLSGAPAPVCSCTGVAHQCYRWGDGGWQSSCCTTSISEYPLPLIPSKSGARVAGRKMSNGAYVKLLQRLASEGHDLSHSVDLKNHWARHGTNKFVTIR